MKTPPKTWAFFLIALLFIALSLGFIARLFYLQVLHHKKFEKKTSRQVEKKINIQSFRGHIFDAKGHKLAISKRAYSLYVSPKKVKHSLLFKHNLNLLAKRLKISPEALQKKASSKQTFVWIKRKMSYYDYKACQDILPSGFYFINEESRYYPETHLLADVLGFVGTDGGLSGIEYNFDQALKGSLGQLVIEGDAKGKAFITSKRNIKGKPTTLGINVVHNPSLFFDGQNIHLTIDSQLQYAVEKHLKESIKLYKAQGAYALVMESQTGNILALADYPTFDPNIFYRSDQESLKNAPLVDIFEPGSIFKPFIYAIGLEQQYFNPDTVWEIPETLTIGKHTIRESHKRKQGAPDHYSSQDIIIKSMNVGTTLMAQKIGAPTIDRYLADFGFGKISQYDMPGESKGIVRPLSQVKDIDLATLSFGQGIGVNLAQIAAAYATLANDGFLVKPNIIQKTSNQNGSLISKQAKGYQRKQIISKETAREVLDTLEKTVSQGSGIRAYIPGFSIGGKTGTAQIPNTYGRGYEKGAYIASFVSILPIKEPRYIIAVSIKRPQGEFLASRVAAPLAKTIAYSLIDLYHIKPNTLPFTLTKNSPLLVY